MGTQKRRPPWGATKKQGDAFAKERALKNRIHELETELAKVRDNERRLAETNVSLNMRINEQSVEIANLKSAGDVYMGPMVEQAVRERVDAEVSKYALGVLRFFFASGKVPR